MNREKIFKKSVEAIGKLPDNKLQELSLYAEFLLRTLNDKGLVSGINEINAKSGSFDYLLDEEDLYTVNDCKLIE